MAQKCPQFRLVIGCIVAVLLPILVFTIPVYHVIAVRIFLSIHCLAKVSKVKQSKEVIEPLPKVEPAIGN